jgi:hypothetical protein
VERSKNILPRDAIRLDDLRAWHVILCDLRGLPKAAPRRRQVAATWPAAVHEAARPRAEAALQQLRQSPRQHLQRLHGAEELNA